MNFIGCTVLRSHYNDRSRQHYLSRAVAMLLSAVVVIASQVLVVAAATRDLSVTASNLMTDVELSGRRLLQQEDAVRPVVVKPLIAQGNLALGVEDWGWGAQVRDSLAFPNLLPCVYHHQLQQDVMSNCGLVADCCRRRSRGRGWCALLGCGLVGSCIPA